MPPFLNDTFTDTDGTSVVSHTPDTGAGWSSVLGGVAEIFGNRARYVSGLVLLRSGEVPPSADYAVEAELYAAATLTTQSIAVKARQVVGASSNIYFQYRAATELWFLEEVAAGVIIASDTWSDPGMKVSGTTRAARLEMVGTRASLFIDGVLRAEIEITTILSAGVIDFSISNTQDFHLASISANTLSAEVTDHDSSAAVTLAITVDHDSSSAITGPFSSDHDSSAAVTLSTTVDHDSSAAVTLSTTVDHDSSAAVTAPVSTDHDTRAVVNSWFFELGATRLSFFFRPNRPYSVARSIALPTGRDSAGNLYAYTKGAKVTAIHRLQIPRLDVAAVAALLAFHQTTTRGTGLTFTWFDFDATERTVRFADRNLTPTPTGPGRWSCDVTLEEMT